MTTSSGTTSSSSQPGSQSGSRQSDFPPRPKSVRVWPVVPAAIPVASLSEQSEPNEAPSTSPGTAASTAPQPQRAVSGQPWAWIFAAGLAAIGVGLLALWLAKNLQSYLVR